MPSRGTDHVTGRREKRRKTESRRRPPTTRAEVVPDVSDLCNGQLRDARRGVVADVGGRLGGSAGRAHGAGRLPGVPQRLDDLWYPRSDDLVITLRYINGYAGGD